MTDLARNSAILVNSKTGRLKRSALALPLLSAFVIVGCSSGAPTRPRGPGSGCTRVREGARARVEWE